MVLKKHEIEKALHEEHIAIASGQLKEDNPLDQSEGFQTLCEACRRGDLKQCQEKLQEGVNINGRDRFDYTPLILASLCGHFEVVRLLLESGALCERDTFQGERSLYNALNDRIRALLLSYDYSKAAHPLQPLAGHITSLLHRQIPDTSDITLATEIRDLRLHKFVLAARSPYFERKLRRAPDTEVWRVPGSLPVRSLEIAVAGLYFGEVGGDLSAGDESDRAVLAGVDKLARQLEIKGVFETVLEGDRRLARQRRGEEMERGREQLDGWFRQNVLENGMRFDGDKVDGLKWDRRNSVFADVLLCAFDEEEQGDEGRDDDHQSQNSDTISLLTNGIPIGPTATPDDTKTLSSSPKATVYPAHKALLLRSEYFHAMFTSPFRESQSHPTLPLIKLDCSPPVLRIILTYLYTERADFSLSLAIPVLFAADQLFIDRLKHRAAVIISTLGNGAASVIEPHTNPRGRLEHKPSDQDEIYEEEPLDIYEVIRAGWDTRVHRLEEFGARYIAYRLERYIEQEDFKELVRESAARIKGRQETDTVELIDDIRYYLSERFRLRFEDSGIDEMTAEEADSAPGQEQEAAGKLAELHLTSADDKAASDAQLEQRQGDVGGGGTITTLDGDIAGDEFAQDALNYQILLGKIDTLLDELQLDA